MSQKNNDQKLYQFLYQYNKCDIIHIITVTTW